MAFPGGGDTGRCCRNNSYRCLPDNAREMGGRDRSGSRAHASRRRIARPSASRRGGLHRVAPRDGARQPRCAFSSLRCRPSRPCIRLHRSEQAKTLTFTRSQIVQIQNEAIGLRQTEQLCAPGMFRPPSPDLVRIGRADVRRLRGLERIDEQAGELLGRLAIEQHGDGSDGQHEATRRRHDSQMAVHDPESVFLVASSDCQFGPTFRHRYLSSALPHCHRIGASNRADKLRTGERAGSLTRLDGSRQDVG